MTTITAAKETDRIAVLKWVFRACYGL